MDVPSFKNGYRLKRLQQASQTIKNQTLKLLLALKKTQEEVGHTAAISVYVDLKNLKPTCSNETMSQKLDQAEQELLDVAQTVIGFMCIPNCKGE
jgi:hypothetical protein